MGNLVGKKFVGLKRLDKIMTFKNEAEKNLFELNDRYKNLLFYLENKS